jgi:hypothetical protein
MLSVLVTIYYSTVLVTILDVFLATQSKELPLV